MAEHGMTVWVKLSILKETFGPIRLLENNINDKQHNIYGEFRSVFFFFCSSSFIHLFVPRRRGRCFRLPINNKQANKQTKKKTGPTTPWWPKSMASKPTRILHEATMFGRFKKNTRKKKRWKKEKKRQQHCWRGPFRWFMADREAMNPTVDGSPCAPCEPLCVCAGCVWQSC